MSEFRGRIYDPGDDISSHQTDFATSLRIPLLRSSNPRWSYITGIVVRDDSSYIDYGEMPNEDEISAVAQRLTQYCDKWYRDCVSQSDEILCTVRH